MTTTTPKRGANMRVLKVRGGQEVRLRLVCSEVLWVGQHWLRHAELCTGDSACAACGFTGLRTVGFAGVLDPTGRVGLLEVSPTAWLSWLDQAQAVLSSGVGLGLVGLDVVARRRASRHPLLLGCTGFDPGVRPLAFSRVLGAVAVLFRLPAPAEDETAEAFFTRVQPLLVERAELAVRLARRRDEMAGGV